MKLLNYQRSVVTLITALVLTSGALVSATDLKTIMADPDWIGAPVEAAWWQLDDGGYFYRAKRPDSTLRDTFAVTGSGEAELVSAPKLGRSDGPNPRIHRGSGLAVSIRGGAVVLRDLNSLTHRILFSGVAPASRPQFSPAGDAVFFQTEQRWWRVDLASGSAEALTPLVFKDAPHAISEDGLAQEQLRLFSTLERERLAQQEQFEASVEQEQAMKSGVTPWYLGAENQLVDSALSPNGRWLLVSVTAATSDTNQADKMPHYVTRSGYVDVEDVRRLVGRESPKPQALWLLDMESRQRYELSTAELPGIDSDPLADLKSAQDIPVHNAENPRPVSFERLIWHDQGADAVVQVHAIDNKDRWTLRLTAETREFDLIEHLHDPAWINWQFNDVGWIPNSEQIWWLSESSGYSHLYATQEGGTVVQYSQGEFEVTDVAWLPDGESAVALSNRAHPTEYDLYRLNVDAKKWVPLTELRGVESFTLHPNGTQALALFSQTYRPTQAVVVDLVNGNLEARTDTVNDAYSAIRWQSPEFVAIPSRHGVENPIWSKFYPAQGNFEGLRPIVMFVHGAGYTQNTHHKFPYYFREQMFHNLLTERGYHVLDMDYRASRGYGRDWRTAIYRQMGTPELEDLIDGVQWLVEQHGGDPQRVGVYGGSYGGFMAFMALFNAPDVFAAGAALRPVTDWRHYNDSYTANILNTPEVDPEAHRRSSPIEFVEGFEGALLISHGMLDDNVFYKDSVRLVQRLIELEKEHWELASYPLEPHGYVHPESWLDQYRRILKLFESELTDAQ